MWAVAWNENKIIERRGNVAMSRNVVANLPWLDGNTFSKLGHIIGKGRADGPIAEVAHVRLEDGVDHELFIVIQNSS